MFSFFLSSALSSSGFYKFYLTPWEGRYFQIPDIENCNMIKSLLKLKVRKMFIRLLKDHFFKIRITWNSRQLFCLVLCCSFSTLSRCPLTFTNQQISICLLLISTQKPSINENNLLQFPPEVSFNISFPFLLNYPLASVETIWISSEKQCGKRRCKWLLISENRFLV